MKKFFSALFYGLAEVLDDGWSTGAECLIADDLISFYAFCSTIIVEIAFLWIQPTDYSIYLTVILSCCILNLILTALCKACINPNFHTIGKMIFALLFIVGICVNRTYGTILMIIPFIVTYFAIILREYQCTNFCYSMHNYSAFEKLLINFTSSGFGRLLSFIISPFLPLILHICFILLNPHLSIILKIVLIVLFIIITPFFAVIEDCWCTQNFYELLFEDTETEDENSVNQNADIQLKDAVDTINNYKYMIEEGKKIIDLDNYKKTKLK